MNVNNLNVTCVLPGKYATVKPFIISDSNPYSNMDSNRPSI